MNHVIIVLSGPIGSGKSTTTDALAQLRPIAPVSTSKLLRSMAGDVSREALLSLGNDLERREGAWMGQALRRALVGHHSPTAVVLDCVRTASMVDKIRAEPLQGVTVLHVHLNAPSEIRNARVNGRGEIGDIKALDASGSNGFQEETRLHNAADLVLDTVELDPRDIAAIVWAYVDRRLGLSSNRRLVDVVVGGQTGSEGKGHVISRIADQYGVLCRVGGPNAGHSVVSPADGRKVSFYHLPSGVLHSDAAVMLGAGAVINPEVLMKEIATAHAHGRPVAHRLLIDPNAIIITEQNIADERALVASIGSTGQGVGEATLARVRRNGTALRACEFAPFAPWVPRVGTVRERLDEYLRLGRRVMMEGTQGTGLSLYHGPYPYVTSRDTTAGGTAAEMGLPPGVIDRVIMVCRTNPIRVQSPVDGTSGPMAKEISWDVVARRSDIPLDRLIALEKTTTTKRDRRVAEFDFDQLRVSSQLNRPTDVAVTFVDYISNGNAGASRYEQLTAATRTFIERVELVSGARVSLISTGFGPNTVIVR